MCLNMPKNEKEIRCPRNPIFGKNRISQTVPKLPKKSDFLGKNRICQTVPKVPKKSDFLENRISQTVCPNVPKNPIFWKNRIFQTVPKLPKKSDFFWKNRISFEMEWSGNFRFRVLVFIKRRQTSRVGQVDSAFVVISFFSEIFFHQNLVI
jgi:hypothetical protein